MSYDQKHLLLITSFFAHYVANYVLTWELILPSCFLENVQNCGNQKQKTVQNCLASLFVRPTL